MRNSTHREQQRDPRSDAAPPHRVAASRRQARRHAVADLLRGSGAPRAAWPRSRRHPPASGASAPGGSARARARQAVASMASTSARSPPGRTATVSHHRHADARVRARRGRAGSRAARRHRSCSAPRSSGAPGASDRAPGAGSGAGSWHRPRTPAGRVRGSARVAPEHHVARDRLIERRRLEAVGAGQVEHAVAAAAARTDEAGLPCARR